MLSSIAHPGISLFCVLTGRSCRRRCCGCAIKTPMAAACSKCTRREKRILDYMRQVGIADPYPVRVLHPIIYPGNKDWREYYRNNNLNLPEQYHNGGIWPFVGGFYVAALVKAGRVAEARRQLEKLAQLNRLGVEEEWEFNEWCQGRSGQPMGYPHQAWSAGMYIDVAVRAGLHCAPQAHRTADTLETGALRFSPGFFNTADEVRAAAEALQAIVGG